MKIAHFVSTSGIYGAERWVLGLMNHMDDKETVLMCSNFDNTAVLSEARKLSLNTILLNVKGNFHIPSFTAQIRKAMAENEVDILHTHGYKTDILGFIATRNTKVPIISTPHGWDKTSSKKLLVYQALDQLFLKFFDMVAPLSQSLTDSLRWVNPKKIQMIKNFTDLSTLPSFQRGDPKLISYIGQLISRKRVKDLINAMGILSDPEVRLQIIGDGREMENLVRLTEQLGLQHKITFHGFRLDRLELLNNSGIFILPSVLEGIPRAMMEAMGMGKLVIGSDIPGISDLIEHKKTGLLFPPKNPQAIADVIEYVTKNKELVENIRKKGKELVESEYSAKRAATDFKKLYFELLN